MHLNQDTQPSFDTNNEYARVISWDPSWNLGAPCPQLFSNGYKTYLIYYINEPDPAWDGSYTTMINPGEDNVYPLALVEFIHPHSHRFGIVNDEAAHGHPLYEKGLETYAAHIIENSSWISELKKIHRVHHRYSELHWSKRNHFLLFFHDEILEVIADDYKIETYKSTFQELSIEVVGRLNS